MPGRPAHARRRNLTGLQIAIVAGPVALVLVLLWLATRGGGDPETTATAGPSTRPPTTRTTIPTTTTTTTPARLSTVAQGALDRVEVFAAPDETTEPIHVLDNPTEVGAPLVFLVVELQPDWLRVMLPVRPNGSQGWIRASDVTLSTHDYRITVELSAFRITVYDGTEVILQEAIGIGTNDTPTPGGTYYIKELLQPPNPNGVYGAYAYGLSGFSNELTSFAGGEGVIGIHGTNDPSTLGTQVSHGCVRMSNDGITLLAGILPLGVPVDILP